MNGLLLDPSQAGTPGHHNRLRRVSLNADAGRDEKWLQRLLFDHPGLIPLDVIDPGAKGIIPVCRELSISKDGSTIFLDHADQAAHRHGGNNWAKLPFPAPIDWITAYCNKTDAGIFFRLTDEDGHSLYDELIRQADDLRSETNIPLAFDVKSGDPFNGTVAVTYPLGPSTDPEQLLWLCAAANSFVNAFRVRIP